MSMRNRQGRSKDQPVSKHNGQRCRRSLCRRRSRDELVTKKKKNKNKQGPSCDKEEEHDKGSRDEPVTKKKNKKKNITKRSRDQH